MNRLLTIIFLLVLVSVPMLGFAQDGETAELDTCLEQIKRQCPISHGEDWEIIAVESADDTVSISLIAPASLAGFITMLTEDNINAKRLWIQHLSQYGEQCRQLVGLLAQAGRTLKLEFRPREAQKIYYLYCRPEDLGTILAND